MNCVVIRAVGLGLLTPLLLSAGLLAEDVVTPAKTRPEMKRRIEALKERTSRLPLPDLTEEQRAAGARSVNNGRLRAIYLPESWQSQRPGSTAKCHVVVDQFRPGRTGEAARLRLQDSPVLDRLADERLPVLPGAPGTEASAGWHDGGGDCRSTQSGVSSRRTNSRRWSSRGRSR